MAKVPLNHVGSLIDTTTAQTTINNDLDAIQTGFDNTLSRDGTSPNTMNANLDMNSNRVLNLAQPVSDNEPARLVDLNNVVLNQVGGLYLRYDVPQSLTTPQKTQVQTNIGVTGLAINGTANEINANTVGTTTTLSLPSALTFTGKTVTGGTLSGPALSGATVNGNTLSASAGSGTVTIPNSTTTLVGRDTTDTLTNKTLTTPVISSISNAGTLTLPTGTDTLVGRSTSDTLANKTISGSSNTLSNINVSSMAAQAPYTLVGNSTGSSAVPTAVDISTLTTKASPAGTDYVLLSDQASSGAWKKAAVSGLAGASAPVPFAAYNGLQPLKLGLAVIGVNPGSFADSAGAALYNTSSVLSCNLASGTVSGTQGCMLSPGALSVSGTGSDGVDVMLYLCKRNSDNALILFGDNSNTYQATLNCTVSNGSSSFSTGGPQTGFWNGTKVRLKSTGTFPSGFSNTDYFIVGESSGQNSTTFSLSATYGGSAITAGSTYTGQLSVSYGVQDHLDAQFGVNAYTVLRRVHFAFRWKWQWGTGNGGIPDFTCDPRSDRVYLTYGGSSIFSVTVPSSGTATSATNIDCTSVLSNLNRIVDVRANVTSTGSAGTAYLYSSTAGTSSKPISEGPTAGMSGTYPTATVQTDSSGNIQYNVGGGAKLNALYIEGWSFVDPS